MGASHEPKYRLHKPTNQAVVTINKKHIYLGKYGSPESKEKYHRLLAERPRDDGAYVAVATPSPALTITEMISAYFSRHVAQHYRSKDGSPGREQANLTDALRPVIDLYGTTQACEFGPKSLRAVRDRMITSGLARTTINSRIHRIRRAFRWAAGMELIPGSVVTSLDMIEALKKGRTDAKEAPKIMPVATEIVEATIPFLPAPVVAMVRLQLLTGCRAGEVMAIRGADLDRSKETWEYRPGDHKSAWRDRTRVIVLGPRAQQILRCFLGDDPEAFVFRPKRRSRGARQSPRFDRRTYRQEVVRACDRAFLHPKIAEYMTRIGTAEKRSRIALKRAMKDWVAANHEELRTWRLKHRWSPLQLRHSAATAIRAEYGLEAAQNVLGHAKPDTTLIYAERDLEKVREIAMEIG